MKTQQPTWQYLTLIAVVAVGFSCNTSKQTAQTGEVDDLYGNSGSAVVYADNSRDYTEKRPTTAPTESTRNTGSLRRNNRNANPDYADNQQPYSANEDEYYSELSTRNLNRGISSDPGWGTDNGNGSYNDGFTNGYYAGLDNPAYNSSRWNQWGFNNGFGNGFNNGFGNGFNVGLGLGGGFGGFNRWGGGFNRWGGGFNDPFWGNSFAYNPWGFNNGWGGGFNDPFFSPYAFGGFNNWNSPFGFGGGWGGGFNRPVYVNNNVIVSGADPYRNTRTYGARPGGTSARYNDSFTNTPRPANGNTGGRSAATGTYNPANNGGNAMGNNNTNRDSYYASPRQNSRGSYYYNDGNSNGRGSATGNANTPSTYSPPANSNSGSGEYYARPRQNSQGSYTPSNSGNGNSRGSYQQSESSRSQPSYQQQNRSYQQSRPTQSQPSYSAPSYNSGGSRGSSSGGGGSSSGGGGSSSGGGGGRGPR